MADRVLLDSNILAYVFDSSAKAKQAIAREIVESAINHDAPFVVSLQNINEFFSIVTNKAHMRLPLKDAAAAMDGFLANLPCYCPDTRTAEYALSLVKLYKIPFWDALIAAVMLENAIFTIYTENTQDFSRIPGVKAINPFAAPRKEK